MDKNELLLLRKQILETVSPLVLNGEGDARSQLGLLLDVIRSGGGGADIYKKAYELANGIEDQGERASALLELLSEVELDIERADIGDEEDADGAELGYEN